MRIKTKLIILIILPCFVPMVRSAEHAFGIGIHYFYTLEEIDNDLSQEIQGAYHSEGIALNASYRIKPNPHLGLLFEMQTYPEGVSDAKMVISPRILALLGHHIYAGVGVAWNYAEWEEETLSIHKDDGWSSAYFLLRAGFEFPIIVDDLILDINGTYELNDWNEIEEFDSDLITLGVGVRMTL
jgi:hypothetical protein